LEKLSDKMNFLIYIFPIIHIEKEDNMKTKKFITLSVIAATSIALVGCVPQPPPTANPSSPSSATPTPSASSTSPSPSVTPTPSATPPPTIEPEIIPDLNNSKIVIGSDTLFIKSLDGDIIDRFPFDSNPRDAITSITDLYDREATTEYSGEETCWYQMSTYDWGNFKLSFQTENIDNSEWFIVTSEVDSEQKNPLVETLHGAVAGESYSAYVANVAGNPRLDYDQYHSVLDEQTDDYVYNPEEMNAYGAIVHAVDDTITTIAAPLFLNSEC
jgi:hypothetical protein